MRLEFDLQLFGSSNNAPQQNAQAQQQIAQNSATARQNLAQFLQQNPSPIAGAHAVQGPQQFSGQLPGQNFGQQPPMPPMGGAPMAPNAPAGPPGAMRPPPGAMPPQRPPQPQQPPIPPGLLQLLKPGP